MKYNTSNASPFDQIREETIESIPFKAVSCVVKQVSCTRCYVYIALHLASLPL